MKTLDWIFLNFVRANNDAIFGIFLENFEIFLIDLIQLKNWNTISVPSIEIHHFRAIINLIFDKVELFGLKSVVNTGLILSDELPVCDGSRDFKVEFSIALSLVF